MVKEFYANAIYDKDELKCWVRGQLVGFAKGGTRLKHVGELKGHDNWSTTGQNF